MGLAGVVLLGFSTGLVHSSFSVLGGEDDGRGCRESGVASGDYGEASGYDEARRLRRHLLAALRLAPEVRQEEALLQEDASSCSREASVEELPPGREDARC